MANVQLRYSQILERELGKGRSLEVAEKTAESESKMAKENNNSAKGNATQDAYPVHWSAKQKAEYLMYSEAMKKRYGDKGVTASPEEYDKVRGIMFQMQMARDAERRKQQEFLRRQGQERAAPIAPARTVTPRSSGYSTRPKGRTLSTQRVYNQALGTRALTPEELQRMTDVSGR